MVCLNETLIIAMGEFGRTVGAPNGQNGRDHFLQQAVLMAGARIRGKRAIGTTDERALALRRSLVGRMDRRYPARRYRGDDLLRSRNRLDDGAPRRSSRPRVRVCADESGRAVRARS